MYMHFIHGILNLIQSLMNINDIFFKLMTYLPVWIYIQSSTYIPIKKYIKQSGRKRVVHQQPKTRVDSNFTQYELLFKQHCKYL